MAVVSNQIADLYLVKVVAHSLSGVILGSGTILMFKSRIFCANL